LDPTMVPFRISLPHSFSFSAISSYPIRFFFCSPSFCFIHFFFLTMSFHLCSSTFWPHTFPETRTISFATRFYRPAT
jgi:hypothetical protein